MGINPHNQIFTNHQKRRNRPMGVAEQFSINEKGGRYIKRRVTNDCSFPGPSGLLLNNQVQRESLQPYFYGFCLLRILHMNLRNAKQMDNKTNPYWKNIPELSLPPDTCKRNNRVDMHSNSQRVSLYLPEFTFFYHTCTSVIYNC